MIYFLSDLHLHHRRILQFTDEAGSSLRRFDSIEEMNAEIIQRINSRVGVSDKLYLLGDVCLGGDHPDTLAILSEINCRNLRLVKGNHDNRIHTSEYLKYFDEVYGVREFREHGFVCTHVPIHPESLKRWEFNVHGHLHNRRVLLPDGTIDRRYINVSCELLAYTPVALAEIKYEMFINKP